jgi:hypothetical protein
MPADATLKANSVLSTVCIKPELAKKPEQAGWYFAILQKKFYRMKLREAIKAGNDKDEDGNLIVLEDSEDEQLESVVKKNEKYVPSKTREQFYRCGLKDDYYGVLDLVPFTLPFYSDDEVEK